jgi:hypothetical protein
MGRRRRRQQDEGGRRRKRRRWPWVLLAFVVLLVVGALVADPLLRQAAEERASEQVSEVIGAPADVRLGGSFAGLRLFTGVVPDVEITATDVPIEDSPVSIDRLDLELTNVRVGIDDLRGENEELPDMDEGRFVARIDQQTVSALIRAPRAIADVQLIDGGVALRVAGLRFDADAEAVNGEVLFSSRQQLLELLGGRIQLDLSDQPGSPYVEEVRTDPESMVLSGRLDEFASRGVTDAERG